MEKKVVLIKVVEKENQTTIVTDKGQEFTFNCSMDASNMMVLAISKTLIANWDKLRNFNDTFELTMTIKGVKE